MSVNVKESTLVCPAEETPRHSLWLSRIDMIARMPYSHSPLFYIYSPNEDFTGSKCLETKILREALSRILVPFYPVAGRLKKNEENDRFEIDCNSSGVLFQEVETTHCLADFEGFKPTTELRNLIVPRCDYSGGLSSFPLLLVRVTRFLCGGMCIGFGTHHHLTDGVGFVNFLNSWSRLVRGLELDVQPSFDRTVYLAPRHPPQVKFRHLEYEPPLPPLSPKGFSGGMTSTKEGLFKLSKRQIDILKLQARFPSKEVPSYNDPTTYEVLAGHIWRSACKARGLGGDQPVKLYIPTDGRSRLKDPTLPQGYFGNVVFFTACIAKACDISSKPLRYAVSKVHDALQNVEDIEYLRSAIDYLEQQADLTTLVRGPHTVACPNLSINSWGRLPFHKADFSLGKPKFVGHGGIRYEGQSFFVPSPNDDGSFSLSINLFTVHMNLFENYLYDFVEDRRKKRVRDKIDCNAAGVLFEEVETTHILADFGDFKPNTQFRKLVLPVCDYSGGLSSFPLLLVRVTRFECGGVCIGFGTHHNVADGNGYSYFINSWARLARGLELDVQPLHNRAVYLAARHPPQVNFQHLEYAPAQPIEGNYGDTEIARECLFKLSKHQIDTLKLKATSQSEEVQSYKLSTYEVLAGHVWRCACKARGLIGDQSIKLIIPIDGRSRLQDPTLPKGYFGNVRFFAACTTKACDITSKPLWHAASKVHEALKNVERTDYLRSAIDYLEMQSDLTNLIRGPRDVNNPFFYINSWGRIPFDEADFGWGKPKFVGHGGIRVQGQAFFVPSPSRDGSFSLSINLSTLHMPLFENYLYDF